MNGKGSNGGGKETGPGSGSEKVVTFSCVLLVGAGDWTLDFVPHK